MQVRAGERVLWGEWGEWGEWSTRAGRCKTCPYNRTGRAWLHRGGGDDFFCGEGRKGLRNGGRVLFVGGDVEGNGARHEEIIVIAVYGTEGAIGFAFVLQIFIEGGGVALDIGVFAQHADEIGNENRFGLDVGMETIAEGFSFAYILIILFAGIEVRIGFAKLGEDIGRVVSIDGAFFIVCFEGVAFYDEESIVIEGGYLCGFPGKEIHIGVIMHLGDDNGLIAIDKPIAINDDDNAIIGLGGASANINGNDISIEDGIGGVFLWQIPDVELGGGVFNEMEGLEGGGAGGSEALDIAGEIGLGGGGAQEFDLVSIKDVFAGIDEGFGIGGGVFGIHVGAIAVFLSFLFIPVYGFERSAEIP